MKGCGIVGALMIRGTIVFDFVILDGYPVLRIAPVAIDAPEHQHRVDDLLRHHKRIGPIHRASMFRKCNDAVDCGNEAVDGLLCRDRRMVVRFEQLSNDPVRLFLF
jgi:hypothetical protein